MSMDSRYQAKIRKLLALSQSDNPHEAETAKRQAMSLMKKYRIDVDELDIISTYSRPIKRKTIKEYEHILVSAIMEISGVYALHGTRPRIYGGRIVWDSYVEFIGLERDAELAAYSFDVIYPQLEKARKEFQKTYGGNAQQADLYCKGWIVSACRKLVNVFGERDKPEEVVKHKAKKLEGVEPSKIKDTKSSGNRGLDFDCLTLGGAHGKNASLNVATTDQQEKQLRIGGEA
ncbi:hypothetical protein C0J08_14640 [Marinomonas sp. CT5]|uniref:DUF2786 domain-containing protein n=1 Tax=Marinomonas sp. CT5 TaxID=2066133 RepID=UPI001BAE6F4F|nr:DUF2786 domain-containing protein [Marinomonas sp. CT5]QUX96558.1 hypothetical protein C0J08_14640 [Marinomonas sp. CT5]